MNKSNILVVDDSVSNLLLIKDILSSNPDYTVFTETDGDNVVPQLNANKIDLVLLDIMMPKVDGYEVCRRIKQDAGFKDIPVIFLTAKVDEASLLRGFEMGGVDYIKKPFLISELMARIKTHLTLKWTNEKLKNELFKHSITQQSLVASQNELSIRNKISQYFLAAYGDEVYPKLLEEILRYVAMDYGVIGYIESDNMDIIDMEKERLICPSIYSGEVDSDRNYIYTIDQIGDVAVAIIRKQAIIQKSNVSRLFFTNAEVSCMIAAPIIYQNRVIGIIACAGRENDHADSSKQKLISLINFIAPIVNTRIEAQINNKRLISSITETQDQERKRFAKDIHDGLGSYLTSLTAYASIMSSGTLNQQEMADMIGQVKDLVQETAMEARNIANGVLPDLIRKFGLANSITYQYNRLFGACCNTTLQFDHSKYEETDNNETKTALFRIANEMLNNTFKYAKAQNISIDLYNTGEWDNLNYKDDGVGFNIDSTMESIKSKKISGLRNIKERVEQLGGTVKMESNPGAGFCVEISLPRQNQE